MFIVPSIPHTTVINKTIIYSDTVLSLKDIGNNIKVTSIYDVSEYDLEKCLKTVFESNPNVIFNTIQYSKKDKKVYFYTNNEISTKEFKESKYKNYKPISSRIEILEEIKRLLISNNINDNNCISLYDIATIISRKESEYDDIKNNYDYCVNEAIQGFFTSCRILIYHFDYDNKILKIGIRTFKSNDYETISFKKENDDLYIFKSEFYNDKRILTALGQHLSNLYDDFMNYSSFKQEASYGIKPINSNFLVNVSSYGVNIYTNSETNRYIQDFSLRFPSYDNEYRYDCNSENIISVLKGNENEIFKKIFVKIEDCPKWSQSILYEIRQNQLEKESKRQKRLALARKFFPFIKK